MILHFLSASRCDLPQQVIRQLLKTPAAAAIALVLTPQAAFAACGDATGTMTTNVECQAASGNAEVNANGLNINVTGIGTAIDVSALSGNATLNINNSTVNTNPSGGIGNHGVRAWAETTAGDSTINLTGTNVVVVNSLGDTGIVSNGGNSDGNSIITIGGELTLTNNVDNTNYADGIEANAINGTSSIVHTGSGTITVHGGNAILSNSTGTGNSKVEIGSGVRLIVDNTVSGVNGVNVNSGIRVNSELQIEIDSAAQIDTLGDNAHGIEAYLSSRGADTFIHNGGAIQTNGANSHGVYARASGSGSITIIGNGAITTASDSATDRSYGIFSSSLNGSNKVMYSGDIITHAVNSSGIRAAATGTGDVEVAYTGPRIEVFSDNSDGIHASARVGSTKVSATGTIITHAKLSGADDGTGHAAFGIAALSSQGDVEAAFTGDLIDVNGLDSAAFYGDSKYGTLGTGVGTVSLINTGKLVARGENGSGIQAFSTTGAITVDNAGAIETLGANGAAILAEADGAADISIVNSGNLTIGGNTSYGILASSAGASVIDVTNSGTVHVLGSGTRGIQIRGGDGAAINIVNNGDILHDTMRGVGQYGIEAKPLTGNNNHIAIENNGNIVGSSFGIVAWSGGVAHTGGTSAITIGSSGYVDSLFGLTADMSDSNTFNILNGGRVNGRQVALMLRSDDSATPQDTVNNSGSITSDSDRILATSFTASNASIHFNNQANGQMTGVMTADNARVTVDNAGQWNLRKFADTDGDRIRDALTVAVSDFGSSGDNHITNSGVITLLGDSGQASTLDGTGAYSTGYLINSMVQGQILNVQTFSNSGVINMSNGAVGDVLIISGGQTPGASGGGVFVANGGQITVDTVLNEGGANSASDMLVVDGTRLGSSATGIKVNNLGGLGAQTTDDGIEVVRVLDISQSAAGVFTLRGRAVAGAYEYELYQGGVDANADNGNWYLRSQFLSPSPTPESVIRPEAGSYVANMAAASKMFNLRLEDREGRAENSSMWLRQQGDRTTFRDGSGQVKTSTNTYVIQGGGELASVQFGEDDRLGLGLMLGYGQSSSKSVNGHSDYSSKGKVDGYSGGVYATWYQDSKSLDGLYVDSWAQYSWLDASVNGEQLASESYDMKGFSASVEGGYRMPVYQGENSQVYVTPQAQVIWNGVKADDHREANGTKVTSDGDNNVQTRLGVKLSRDGVSDMDKGGDKLFTVYTEANWLHNTERAGATMNGVTTRQAGSTNVGELKLGMEGQLSQHANVWTNVAQQLGDDGYSDTALTVGFKYKF
ncbi:hypothetical protein SOASR030_32500 [Leminorella grimontii]|uniref:Autotransporter domain-containing protein n=1 Tax=Leminorella grimontii TaxID=82981 RepID=A0AAV5N6N8_9GAMM|nr:autotransporter outer membrane beta-barrel domain-containing protein [Leminorella grimontii]KFC92644.1 hypothetical protein GLGR_3753 [Leminorella grimontii ATCC 33999 = DSM 5078]GKX57138.1 hypothetical protein SOASR030_32500 [Leminorella grimontii]VFS62629.1 Outer membrane protein IcsA autotransporter precursor [Leminorella grimontii]